MPVRWGVSLPTKHGMTRMRSFLAPACTLLGIRQGGASSVPSASRARRTKGKPNAQLQVNANSLRSCPCCVCVYPCPLGGIERNSCLFRNVYGPRVQRLGQDVGATNALNNRHHLALGENALLSYDQCSLVPCAFLRLS